MSTSPFKEKFLKIVTSLVIVLTTVQFYIPQMPQTNPEFIKVLSALIMFHCTALTAAKQWLSAEIQNKAMRSTLVIVALAIIGGANDLFNVIHLPDITNQWIRFGLTAAAAIINVYSKTMFPTETAIEKK